MVGSHSKRIPNGVGASGNQTQRLLFQTTACYHTRLAGIRVGHNFCHDGLGIGLPRAFGVAISCIWRQGGACGFLGEFLHHPDRRELLAGHPHQPEGDVVEDRDEDREVADGADGAQAILDALMKRLAIVIHVEESERGPKCNLTDGIERDAPIGPLERAVSIQALLLPKEAESCPQFDDWAGEHLVEGQHRLSGKERGHGSPTLVVDGIVERPEGGVSNTETGVVPWPLGSLGAYTVHLIICVGVTNMQLIGTNTDDRAWRRSVSGV